MRVLVTWGSKRGGTEGIAKIVGETLQRQGFEVALLPSRKAMGTTSFDAAIVGGALYANRWHGAARRFVRHREDALSRVPVWFFSSGPLNDSAGRQSIPPTRQVDVLMERVGAQGHATFGGRLTQDANTQLAKKHAGDWRDPALIREWASRVARDLPSAKPHPAVRQKGQSPWWLLLHGFAGWALCAAVMGGLLYATTLTAALVVHAIVAPAVFVVIARHYFQARGAREPITAAAAFAATVGVLDLIVVAGLIQHSLAMFTSVIGTWLPFALIFLATLATGELMATLPWAKRTEPNHVVVLPAPARPKARGVIHGSR
jgi:menaquinone-dependent protoporphyrinogen oxidase